jgi:hypothetical protein
MLALAGGSWIILGVLVAGFFVVVFGWYTRRGSAINQRPYADRNAMSGPERPSELAHDITQQIQNWDRGVGANRKPRRTVPREKLDDEQVAVALQAWRDGVGSQRLGELALETPARGPDDGVEVIVFWDYLDPDSAALARELDKLRATTAIREAALQLPIADARPLSFIAALAAEAGRSQDRFWAVHDRLLERPPRSEGDLLAVGALVPDQERFCAEIDQRIGRDRIIEQIALGTASGVRAIPAVFIGGGPFDGEQTAAALETVINSSTARRWERRIPRSTEADARAPSAANVAEAPKPQPAA